MKKILFISLLFLISCSKEQIKPSNNGFYENETLIKVTNNSDEFVCFNVGNEINFTASLTGISQHGDTIQSFSFENNITKEGNAYYKNSLFVPLFNAGVQNNVFIDYKFSITPYGEILHSFGIKDNSVIKTAILKLTIQ